MSQIEIIFIRHGEAANRWGDHPNPGLSKKGIVQSNNLLKHKELQHLEKYSFLSSPKLRAIETAEPLAKKFNKEVVIDDTFIEIPSDNIKSNDKQKWLEEIIKCKNNDLPNFVKSWKRNIFDKTQSFNINVVIFSHFMVINALVSALAKTDKLLYFYPDYTSVVKIVMKDTKFDYFKIEGNKKTSINL
tara:strand:+ start:57 stop:620 length:564 start_codon:yes stop_codon:yes gene_type:complete